jgi:predicted nucleic acid-binding protein
MVDADDGARRRAGHAAAVGFVDGLERSRRVDVVRVGAELETRALDWLRQHDEREFSFVDATSFMLMDERRLRSALAFDGEFSAAGFAELRAP